MRRIAAAAVAFALLAPAAQAHLVQTGFGAFYDGVVHFVVTPVDLLVVIALALFAGERGRPEARALLVTLPLAWLAGLLLGSRLPATGELQLATTLSLVVAGALAAANALLGRAAVVVLGALGGVLHGLADGATLAGGPLAVAGIGLAVFAVVALVAAIAASRVSDWQRNAVRVAGSWIAAIGLLLLGWMARAHA